MENKNECICLIVECDESNRIDGRDKMIERERERKSSSNFVAGLVLGDIHDKLVVLEWRAFAAASEMTGVPMFRNKNSIY